MAMHVKRVYEPATATDGFRILVDRLWPRGVSKEKAKVDLWLKDIAPSNELREWFNHDPAKWPEFQKRYTQELKSKHDLLDELKQHAKKGTVTLVYGAKDEQHNNAVALLKHIS